MGVCSAVKKRSNSTCSDGFYRNLQLMSSVFQSLNIHGLGGCRALSIIRVPRLAKEGEYKKRMNPFYRIHPL